MYHVSMCDLPVLGKKNRKPLAITPEQAVETLRFQTGEGEKLEVAYPAKVTIFEDYNEAVKAAKHGSDDKDTDHWFIFEVNFSGKKSGLKATKHPELGGAKGFDVDFDKLKFTKARLDHVNKVFKDKAIDVSKVNVQKVLKNYINAHEKKAKKSLATTDSMVKAQKYLTPLALCLLGFANTAILLAQLGTPLFAPALTAALTVVTLPLTFGVVGYYLFRKKTPKEVYSADVAVEAPQVKSLKDKLYKKENAITVKLQKMIEKAPDPQFNDDGTIKEQPPITKLRVLQWEREKLQQIAKAANDTARKKVEAEITNIKDFTRIKSKPTK